MRFYPISQVACIFFFTILSLFLVSTITAQNRSFVHMKDGGQPITNLTDVVSKESTEKIEANVGQIQITIYHQPQLQAEVTKALSELRAAVKIIEKIMRPLPVKNLTFYMAMFDEVPVNYRFDAKVQNAYLHLSVFKNIADLDFENCSFGSVCRDIWLTIPHELSHESLALFIRHGEARWFDEGLAEYVGNNVLRGKTESGFQEKVESYMPQISLDRTDIRKELWNWKVHSSLKSISKLDQKKLNNEFYFYGASFEVIRQLASIANDKETSNPLEKLLGEIMKAADDRKSGLRNADIIGLISKTLNVDVKRIGILSETERKRLVDDASLVLTERTAESDKRTNALYTLAALDTVTISEEVIDMLVKTVLDPNPQNEFQRNLAATALFTRIKQRGFNTSLQNIFAKQSSSSRSSFQTFRKQISDLSIR